MACSSVIRGGGVSLMLSSFAPLALQQRQPHPDFLARHNPLGTGRGATDWRGVASADGKAHGSRLAVKP
jgi:hypothetical protein